MHVNAIGSSWPDRRELDAEALRRSDLIAVDSLEQAHAEAGDLIMAEQEGADPWERTVELGEILAGRRQGRTGPHQITLFKSVGIALQDVATAAHVYQRAKEAGVGQDVGFLG